MMYILKCIKIPYQLSIQMCMSVSIEWFNMYQISASTPFARSMQKVPCHYLVYVALVWSESKIVHDIVEYMRSRQKNVNVTVTFENHLICDYCQSKMNL